MPDCACLSDDEYECYAETHGLDDCDDDVIDDAGGPCECACHYRVPCVLSDELIH